MRKSLVLTAAILAANLSLQAPALADTLENLERERALALETLLSPDLSPVERENKIALSRARLVDLERMVMRDDSLKGNVNRGAADDGRCG